MAARSIETAINNTLGKIAHEAHGLSQKDLPEVAPQPVISEIISGKRKINLRQAQALAKRFSLPIEVFAG